MLAVGVVFDAVFVELAVVVGLFSFGDMLLMPLMLLLTDVGVCLVVWDLPAVGVAANVVDFFVGDVDVAVAVAENVVTFLVGDVAVGFGVADVGKVVAFLVGDVAMNFGAVVDTADGDVVFFLVGVVFAAVGKVVAFLVGEAGFFAAAATFFVAAVAVVLDAAAVVDAFTVAGMPTDAAGVGIAPIAIAAGFGVVTF